MEDLELTNESKQENVEDGNNYIEAIKEMKANTVEKSAYLKLKEENRQLLNSLVRGDKIDVVKEEPVNIEELREKLFKQDSTNLDYISNALKLRNALIEKGEKDPFLPYGKNIIPTDDDIATAERVATKLQECVDYANGDSNIFTNELQRIMVESSPITKRR